MRSRDREEAVTIYDDIPAEWHDELGVFIGKIFAARSIGERRHWQHELRDRYNRQIDKRRDPTYEYSENSNV